MARQKQLVYILSEGNSSKELALINEMLTSKYKNVVFREKEALINFHKWLKVFQSLETQMPNDTGAMVKLLMEQEPFVLDDFMSSVLKMSTLMATWWILV